MKASIKDEKSLSYGSGRGDFVEIETAPNSQPLPMIRIDGPYGAPAEDVFNSEVAILIGAGIGVTPFASILKHIWYRQRRGNLGALKRVEFIWVCRDAPSFGWFQSLLQEVESAQTDRKCLPLLLSKPEIEKLMVLHSQFPPNEHLSHTEDRRRHAVEHCCE